MADDLDEKIARAMADSWHDQIARWYAGAGLPEPRRPPWDSEAHVWATIAAAARAAHEAALKDAGLVIVPREPTEAMQKAGFFANRFENRQSNGEYGCPG